MKYDKSLVKVFNPTVDQLLNIFKSWIGLSVIRPSDLPEILKINLERYGMMEHMDYFKKELKQKT